MEKAIQITIEFGEVIFRDREQEDGFEKPSGGCGGSGGSGSGSGGCGGSGSGGCGGGGCGNGSY